jgi:C-terminal processing protease CtpA/Prc
VVNALEFSFQKLVGDPVFKPSDKVERQPNGKYRWVGHLSLGQRQSSAPTFTGKVLILMNGGSFSAAAQFVSQVHFHKRATFIGEESGGGYYGNSSGRSVNVILPKTKLFVRVPLVTYYMAVREYKDYARGVMPDYPVRYSIKELLAGTDKELALALELARRP